MIKTILAAAILATMPAMAQPQRLAMTCTGRGYPYTVLINSTGDWSKGASFIAKDGSAEPFVVHNLTLIGNKYYAKVQGSEGGTTLSLIFSYDTPELSVVEHDGEIIATCTTEK